MELYEEAMKREERKRKVESEILDKECTFKPHLITKESRLTQSVLQDCLSQIEAGPQGHTPNKSPYTSGFVSGNNSMVVFDRLATLATVKHQKMLHSNGENIDPKTG